MPVFSNSVVVGVFILSIGGLCMANCPHCGQPLPAKFTVTGRERRKLVEILSRRPSGMTRKDLADAIYADDIDGGPDNTFAVCQLVHQARLQLIPQGYTIVSNRGPGAHYRLIRLSS
jgi:hypothetical protein